MSIPQEQHAHSLAIAYKLQPALNTLPSELRRLIVSHLTPNPNELRPGCKQHLKNANLAHSCLREWVPEYMFRNMALKHVLVGMSSHLECFAANPSNAELLKFVKHINVQVPPALRWEIGSDNPFAHHLEEATVQRLWSKFRVKNAAELTDEQRQYGSDYYRAMVEPFTDNRSWYRLLRYAQSSWGQVFNRFRNLEGISVGCCEIVDQPWPTFTHTFVLQHGRNVVYEPNPIYLEDSAVNMAWASSIVLKSAPSWVRHLEVSMCNMDNFNNFATVNRLLSMGHRRTPQPHLMKTTSLSLTIRGIAGTHGSSDWHGDTGSAGYVRHWTSALNSLRDLRHLELHDDMRVASELRFSELEMSDCKASLLDWILPKITLKQLRTLRLCKFTLDTATIEDTFAGDWSCLECLTLEDVILMRREEEGIDFTSESVAHLQGGSWLGVCRMLLKKSDELRIKLIRPESNVNNFTADFSLHADYLNQIANLPRVDLEIKNPRKVWNRPATVTKETLPSLGRGNASLDNPMAGQ